MTDLATAAAEFQPGEFDLELAAAREAAGLNLDWARWRLEHPYEAHPRVQKGDVIGFKLGGVHNSGVVTRPDVEGGHRVKSEGMSIHVPYEQVVSHRPDPVRERADADAATKEHARFVAKVANTPTPDSNGFTDIPHSSGASVRMFGDRSVGVQDSKGMFEYHPSVESAARAAALDDAFVGTARDPKYRLSAPADTEFDYRKFRLHLDQYSDADPDDDGDDEQLGALQSSLQDATAWRDRLRAAGQVAPEVLRAAEQAVTDAQQRLDAYRAAGGYPQVRVNDEI